MFLFIKHEFDLSLYLFTLRRQNQIMMLPQQRNDLCLNTKTSFDIFQLAIRPPRVMQDTKNHYRKQAKYSMPDTFSAASRPRGIECCKTLEQTYILTVSLSVCLPRGVASTQGCFWLHYILFCLHFISETSFFCQPICIAFGLLL